VVSVDHWNLLLVSSQATIRAELLDETTSEALAHTSWMRC
jgi:hypothetical protein